MPEVEDLCAHEFRKASEFIASWIGLMAGAAASPLSTSGEWLVLGSLGHAARLNGGGSRLARAAVTIQQWEPTIASTGNASEIAELVCGDSCSIGPTWHGVATKVLTKAVFWPVLIEVHEDDEWTRSEQSAVGSKILSLATSIGERQLNRLHAKMYRERCMALPASPRLAGANGAAINGYELPGHLQSPIIGLLAGDEDAKDILQALVEANRPLKGGEVAQKVFGSGAEKSSSLAATLSTLVSMKLIEAGKGRGSKGYSLTVEGREIAERILPSS